MFRWSTHASGRALMRRLAAVAALTTALSAVLVTVALADGTETLGPPSVPLATGSGFAAAGVGTADGQPESFTVDVPAGAAVKQVLLYWQGYNLSANQNLGHTIVVNGHTVPGVKIGGEVLVFANAWSNTYRQDITALGLVGPGSSNLTVSGMNFSRVANGAGVLVVYDDGSTKALGLVDGHDYAFHNANRPELQTTVPQTFTFAPASFARTVDLTFFASSVQVNPGAERPNVVAVTIDGATTLYDTPFRSADGNEWDTFVLPVTLPAGVSAVTVQVRSENIHGGRDNPSSLVWIGTGAAVSLPAALGDKVWLDEDADGVQDPGEPGVPGVTVVLEDCAGTMLATQVTDSDGEYLFDGLEPGCYQVRFEAPADTEFTTRYAGDPNLDSDADPTTGRSGQVTLVSGQTDLSIDAGLVGTAEPAIHIEKYTKVVPKPSGSGDVCPTLGKPTSYTFVYTGEDAASSANSQGTKATASGDPAFASPVNIVASEKADGTGKIFFSGQVTLNGSFTMTAAAGGATSFGANTYFTIRSLGGAVLQTVGFHTSCSAPIVLEDTFGALELVAMSSAAGSVVVPPPDPGIGDDADNLPGPQASVGDGIVWTYLVTNPGTVPLADVTVVDDHGTADPGDDFVADPVLDDDGFNVGDTDKDGLLDPGEEWVFEAGGIAVLGQYRNLGTVTGTAPGGDTVTASDPSHYHAVFTGELCASFGKPKSLTFQYTGEGPAASNNGQAAGKWSVSGDPMGATPVRIVVSEKADGTGAVYFDGIVDLGGSFVATAATEFKADTFFRVMTLGGTLLQSVKIHTSCSTPMHLGDQFGSLIMTGYLGKNGGPGVTPPSGITGGALTFKDKNVEFKVTNLGSTKVYIVGATISFPQATNGVVKKFKRNKDVLWDGKAAGKGSPATLALADLIKDQKKRELKGGETKTLKFEFEKKVSTTPGAYVITVTFSDGTVVTF